MMLQNQEKLIPNLIMLYTNSKVNIGDFVTLGNKSGVVMDVRETGEFYVLMEGSLN